MHLRSAAGRLAVSSAHAAGGDWVRPALVAALDEYATMVPSCPALWPLQFATLGALGTLTSKINGGDAITAEALYNTARDTVAAGLRETQAAALQEPRGRVMRAQLFYGFADLLADGRRAEQRQSEITALRQQAVEALGEPCAEGGTLSLEQQRMAMVVIPTQYRLRQDELFSE